MEGWLEIRKMALAPWAADILNFRYMFFSQSQAKTQFCLESKHYF
jgi:hypothetical protein